VALEAGASTRDITPRAPAFLVGYPHVERVSEGVHDPLGVWTLVLRSGGKTCVVASLDLLFISPATARQLRESVAARVGTSPEGVLVGCTHTHSGPVTNEVLAWRDDPLVGRPDPGYMAFLMEQVALSVDEALSRLEPAELARTSARTRGVGGNRLDPRGPADPDAGILLLRARASRRPIACVLCYAMHPTVLHEDSRLVSSDFPWATRRHLRSALGDDLVTVYLTGTAGNQSPRHTTSANTFGEADRLGTLLGGYVLEALLSLGPRDFASDIPLSFGASEVDLPRRRFPEPRQAEEVLRSCRARFASLRASGAPRPDVRTAECAVFGAEETVTLAVAQASGELDRWLDGYSPAAVQVLRAGPAALAGLPGELYVEHGLELKRRAPPGTLVAELVNGDLQGYIVTEEAVRQGTYEALLSVFEPRAGELLVEAALALLRP
jgi:neutral ceramidase